MSKIITFDDMMKSRDPADITKALQINLGYSIDTHIPPIDEFIEDDDYLGRFTEGGTNIYPYWRGVLRDIFPNPLLVKYDTVFLRSAIGTGKSAVSRIIFLYVMAKMILMENPHQFYKLMPNKDLVTFLYSLTSGTTSQVMFGPLTSMIDSSYFFKTFKDHTVKGYKFKNKVTINQGSTIAKNVGKDIFLFWMDKLVENSSI